jgi:prepilin-type N-terminal cleavage/methylation domain-containing protein
MTLTFGRDTRARTWLRAFTFVELLVAMALSSIVMTAVGALTIYSARTFVALGNYTDLDLHSRNALDVIGRELRQATAVIDTQTNATVNYVQLTNANLGVAYKLSWDTSARTVVFEKTGQAAQLCLTECDRWNFALFNRAPNFSSTNISFNAASTLAEAKLINMSWKCSRTIMGSRLNTESVQTAQIVLRNKVK